MSADLEAMKKRRDVMLKVNGVAAVIAVASIVAKFKFDIWWALWIFVPVLLVGFATQIWFVYGLTDPKPKKSSAPKISANKGA